MKQPIDPARIELLDPAIVQVSLLGGGESRYFHIWKAMSRRRKT